jgi:polyketide biosynthesis 3-hydroxy-3-methylglutaryl-CoA synthase-like enzyme PksG
MITGIESLGVYCGSAGLDLSVLAKLRKLDEDRFIKNLIATEKSVIMPFEDSITYAVNAAKQIVDELSQEERDSIKMVITSTENGIDFSKSISTYVHDYLGLSKNCRLFEIKQACYSGTAALLTGINFVKSEYSHNYRALVITTDAYRNYNLTRDDLQDLPYYEANTGAGAVAMLISANPKLIAFDPGANGIYGYEVWDTGRPIPDYDVADADLSLLTYLECCEKSFKDYAKIVDNADYEDSFRYMVYHTPFVGMVKGAHRAMMKKFKQKSSNDIDLDYEKRVEPGTFLNKRVGNIMGGSVYLALSGLLSHEQFDENKRIALFSYGSGCSSEFFSGVIPRGADQIVKKKNLEQHLDDRYMLGEEEYLSLFDYNENLKFGKNNINIDRNFIPGVIKKIEGKGILVLDNIDKTFYRHYKWI